MVRLGASCKSCHNSPHYSLVILKPQLETLMNDVHATVSELRFHVIGLSSTLNHLYRFVQRHDSWTCPCSVQHALLELTRSYELSHGGMKELAFELHTCYNMAHPWQAQRAVERCLRSEAPLPFPALSAHELHLGQIQRYLDSDPGWLSVRRTLLLNSANSLSA